MDDSLDNTAACEAGREELLAAMQAFQQGDKTCFQMVYEHLWRGVYLRASKMGLSRSDSEEIAQKVLVRVYLYASRASFRSARRLWSWVYTITVREVYKHWRRRRPELLAGDLPELLSAGSADCGEDPTDAAATAEEMRDVGDCIGRLEQAERVHLLGPLVQGLSFRQAAALHALTLGVFKHRYERALQKVRDCMKSKGHEL